MEEFTEAGARAQPDTNFFGALWVSQAALPMLREHGSGHIVQISSGGGPTVGLYSTGKFALEGMSEALAAEVARFGIQVAIVRPGGCWTDLYATLRQADPLDAYDTMRAELAGQRVQGSVDGEPRLAAEALLTLVAGEDPPLHPLLGSMVHDLAFDVSCRRMETWADWESVSRAAERAVPAPGVECRP